MERQRDFQVPGPDAFGRVRLARVVMVPGQVRGVQVQTTYQLIFILSGETFVSAGHWQGHRVPGGHVILLRPQDGTHRRTIGKEESEQSWVAVMPEVLTAEQMASLDAAPFLLPLSPVLDHLQRVIIDVAFGLGSAEDALVPLAVGTLMLFVEEARRRGLMDDGARLHPAVAAAREVVRQRLHERIGLKDMAEAAHVTPEHLVRLFRQELGTTPGRYLWGERVRAGVHLLEHTRLPVGEIAARAGFQTASHFSRHVQTSAGLRPGELRRRLWSSTAAVGHDSLLSEPSLGQGQGPSFGQGGEARPFPNNSNKG